MTCTWIPNTQSLSLAYLPRAVCHTPNDSTLPGRAPPARRMGLPDPLRHLQGRETAAPTTSANSMAKLAAPSAGCGPAKSGSRKTILPKHSFGATDPIPQPPMPPLGSIASSESAREGPLSRMAGVLPGANLVLCATPARLEAK